MGDFQESDLNCPTKRRRYWNITQAVVAKQKNTIKALRLQNMRQERKILCLNKLICELKEEKKLWLLK